MPRASNGRTGFRAKFGGDLRQKFMGIDFENRVG